MDLSTDAPLDDAGSMASAALALTTDGEVIFSGAWGDLSPRLTPRVALPSVPRRWGPAPPALAFAPPRGPRGTASPSRSCCSLAPSLGGLAGGACPLPRSVCGATAFGSGPAPRTTIVAHRPTRRQADRQTGPHVPWADSGTPISRRLLHHRRPAEDEGGQELEGAPLQYRASSAPLRHRRPPHAWPCCGSGVCCARRTVCAPRGTAAVRGIVRSTNSTGGGRAVQRSVAWCKCAARCHTACLNFHNKEPAPARAWFGFAVGADTVPVSCSFVTDPNHALPARVAAGAWGGGAAPRVPRQGWCRAGSNCARARVCARA